MISMKTMAAAAAAMAVIGMGAVSTAALAKDGKPAMEKPHSAESIECSKQDDAKGLHGKARKHFREHCKAEMKHHHTDKK